MNASIKLLGSSSATPSRRARPERRGGRPRIYFSRTSLFFRFTHPIHLKRPSHESKQPLSFPSLYDTYYVVLTYTPSSRHSRPETPFNRIGPSIISSRPPPPPAISAAWRGGAGRDAVLLSSNASTRDRGLLRLVVEAWAHIVVWWPSDLHRGASQHVKR